MCFTNQDWDHFLHPSLLSEILQVKTKEDGRAPYILRLLARNPHVELQMNLADYYHDPLKTPEMIEEYLDKLVEVRHKEAEPDHIVRLKTVFHDNVEMTFCRRRVRMQMLQHKGRTDATRAL